MDLSDDRPPDRGDRVDIGGSRLDTLCGSRVHEALDNDPRTKESFRYGHVAGSHLGAFCVCCRSRDAVRGEACTGVMFVLPLSWMLRLGVTSAVRIKVR
jgi:hypothetical protein